MKTAIGLYGGNISLTLSSFSETPRGGTTTRGMICVWPLGDVLMLNTEVAKQSYGFLNASYGGKDISQKIHPHRLETQHTLAQAYLLDGKAKKAVELLEQVNAIKRRILAEDHPSRLRSQRELARACQLDGQTKKTIELYEQIIAIEKRMLAEDYPDRLASQHELALAYQEGGQPKKTEQLLEQV